ncbi:hypothetical protein NMG60_11034943 [Bertholletia excelsa]
MEALEENQLELAVFGSTPTFQGLLDSQKGLFHSQIDQLHSIVATQCQLTGVNPLSQEMAAGALSIKIGKRPRDLLNPKALKYMQSVFSVKDAITKKESREISALFGVTVTQVREFFTSQRSRVRKFVRLSREKALRSNVSKEVQDGAPMSTDPTMPVYPVPLNSLEPANSEEGPSCSTQDETLLVLGDSDKYFLENIFSLMRKEETFSGQVKLMEWVLQIQNSSALHCFLTKGGVMILATWISQAASEEQTSVLHVILKVLCHLPLHKALPVHMSAILQSVNKLRFYRTSDISNRARILLSRWSKIFARSQAMKKPNAIKSSTDAQNEMLLKQSINEIMGDDWDSKVDVPEDTPAPAIEVSESSRKLESPQPLKLLTASGDDSSKKLIRGVSSQNRERRKVLLVEQPGQKPAGRSLQATKSTSNQGRPMSADDIQKAKMRAQFMQSKHGKSSALFEGHQMKTEGPSKFSSSARTSLSTLKAPVRPEVEEHKNHSLFPSKPIHQEASFGNKMDLDEPLWKKCERVRIPWQIPAEIRISDVWRVGTGENSKEIEVQRNRNKREKETIYRTILDIPSNPKEPWDQEMVYDDSLTPQIPTEQLPDSDVSDMTTSPREKLQTHTVPAAPGPSENGVNAGSNVSMAEPDLQLLAILLKNPELVFALTSGRAGNLTSEETVKLLDMIKARGVESLGSLNGLGGNAEGKVEVSLPSPTPSSDPVTNGWRPDVIRNPFSRQNAMAQRAAIPVSEVPVSVPMQEKPSASLNVVAQQTPMVPVLPQQSQISKYLPQTAALLPEKPPPPIVIHQSAAIMQLPPSEILPNVNVGPLNGSLVPTLAASAFENSGYVKPSRISIPANTPELQPVAAFPPAVSLPTPTPLPARSQPPEPLLSAHSRRATQGLASNSHLQINQNNHNAFLGGPMQPPLQLGHPRDRGDLVGEPAFESWSPERSPISSSEHLPGWNHPEPRMSLGHNYRSELGPSRSRPWNSSGYRDRDYNRHGHRRGRDWRR